MNEHDRNDEDRPARVVALSSGAVPPAAVQTALPLPADVDAPVPYRLTPVGRAQVAPVPTGPAHGPGPDRELPELDDREDPRRASARALRRGGLSPARIARRLDVDELAVRVWIGDARPVRAAVEPEEPAAAGLPTIDPHERAFRATRDAAAASIAGRLSSVSFTRGLSLVAATGVVDRHAVLVTTADPGVAVGAVRWLRDHAGADLDTTRAIVRLADRHGGDLAARRWADRLGVDRAALRVVTWTAPPRPDAVEVMIRVADQEVAARVTGWRDALLGMDDPDTPPQVVAF